MASENEPIETVVRASVEPSTDSETVEGDVAEATESEVEDTPTEEDSQPKEQMVRRNPEESNKDGLADVDDETPRERAMRLEITRLRDINRKERGNEIIGQAPAPIKKEIDPKNSEVLKKYKQTEIDALREVLPALADEMGYVRSDQLNANQYNQKATEALDDFLKTHTEYLPENDKDNVLWTRFREEVALYKTPTDARDFPKLFNRAHKDIFGIKVAGEGKGKQIAAERKVNSAAHAGASTTTRTVTTAKKVNASGLRLDMLKGFTDEEKADLLGE